MDFFMGKWKTCQIHSAHFVSNVRMSDQGFAPTLASRFPAKMIPPSMSHGDQFLRIIRFFTGDRGSREAIYLDFSFSGARGGLRKAQDMSNPMSSIFLMSVSPKNRKIQTR